MPALSSLIERLESDRDRHVAELLEFLRIPSVSADSTRKADMERCARFVAEHLAAAGLATEILPTAGHPAVYGERLEARGRPTILVYGHYDVQPPDPLALWQSDPFEPRVAGDDVFARGAADDKGQLFTHVKAVEGYRREGLPLPVNVKFLIEGEEEISSIHLDDVLRRERRRLACDYVVISDTNQFAAGIPAITYGLRGICYMELHVLGPDKDLHSGGFGGTVANPANVLAALLASLKDGQGRILLPGFYDDVRPLEEWERRMWADLPFDDEGYRAMTGAPCLAGEEGYTVLERRWARPTLDVNGIFGGYAGEGSKTIIPSWAGAKVSLRLVPEQDPARTADLFERTLADRCPPGVRLRFLRHSGGKPVLVPVDTPGMQASRRAIEKGFGRAPVLVRTGGSIPVVSSFKEILGADSLLLGWGRPDDNCHAPNEKFNLGDYQKAIRTSALLLQELAAA